jgi:hypothetical protein
MASTTLDLPQPFGPTMQVVPVPLNVTTVRSLNDLNPVISTFRSFNKMSPLTLSFEAQKFSRAKNLLQVRVRSFAWRSDTRSAKRDDSSFPDGGMFLAMLSLPSNESCLSTPLTR